ncbi:MAG: sulfurtransferase TusA family protein [Oscillospiraceae bacterium]|nr:sulfurtransferase TusA family protein [Oscillospiraceae bacterium]
MIDARGLACPLPVLKVQQEVKKNDPKTLEVLVDNHAAVQNVTRFANNSGYQVSVKELEDDEFSLTLSK